MRIPRHVKIGLKAKLSMMCTLVVAAWTVILTPNFEVVQRLVQHDTSEVL